MFVLGHLGITLGVAELLQAALRDSPRPLLRLQGGTGDPSPPGRQPVLPGKTSATPAGRSLHPQRTHTGSVDYRLVLLGALLPDLIDKPLGTVIFVQQLSNGRVFAHTLLFAVVTVTVAFFLRLRRGKTWGLLLAYGWVMHLVLDEMWDNPRTFLWPLHGWGFERLDIAAVRAKMIATLLSDPRLYGPEIVGGLILAFFALRLALSGRLRLFLRAGSAGE